MSPRSALDVEEIDESERLLAELSAGLLEFTPDPMLRLLRSARGPASADELIDATNFAERVVHAASTELTAQQDVVGNGRVAPRHRRLRLVGRTLVAKFTLIAAIGILGVAGAGAATGVIVASQQRSDMSTTSIVPAVPAFPAPRETFTQIDAPADPAVVTTSPPAPADPKAPSTTMPAPVAGDVGEGRSRNGRPTTSAGPTASAATGGETTASSPDRTVTPRGTNSDARGATNGNSSNAGGNPNPGSNGAANGHSPDAGGQPTNDHPGADNGNGAARSGDPAGPTT